VAGSGFASDRVCPSAIEVSKSKAASRRFLHRKTLPSSLSNAVFII
jgi:hypothetical protein